MSHHPERDAAAFVGGAMRPGRARRFEAHLVECDDCWQEVRAGLTGRTLAESAREGVPSDLRESIRAHITAAAVDTHRARIAIRPSYAAVIVAMIVAGSAALVVRPDAQPAAIVSAVRDFMDDKMVSAAPPHAEAPDLSSAGFGLAYTGSGSLAGQIVDGYLYKDDAGRRVLVYISDDPFPVARGAALLPDGESWRTTIEGVALLCTAEPHGLLALSDDDSTLDDVAVAMGMTV